MLTCRAVALREGGCYFGAGAGASFWNRGSFRSGSNIGSSRSSAGVIGAYEASGPLDGIESSFCKARVGTTPNWKLTFLNLPSTGQLRARGRTINGFFNGSSSLIEQVAAYTAPPPLTLGIVQVGTATYNAGFNVTSTAVNFVSLPSTSVNMEDSTDLNSWTAYAGNPVNTGAGGSFSVTLNASGDQTAIWNKKMFFRASRP
jgi:hypothetical protein